MKLIQYFITTALLGGTLFGITLEGVGYAKLSNEAKKESLSDLSHTIQAEVKSSFTTVTKALGDGYEKSQEKFMHVSSDLPLLGVEFEQIDGVKVVKTTAKLSSKTALKLYNLEIQRVYNNIKASTKELQNTKNESLQYTLLKQLLEDIQRFEKHTVVATLLGADSFPKLPMTQVEAVLFY